MEYEFPTEFNEFGLNIKSPTVQYLAQLIEQGGGKLPPIFKGVGNCTGPVPGIPFVEQMKPFLQGYEGREIDMDSTLYQFGSPIPIAKEINRCNNENRQKQSMNYYSSQNVSQTQKNINYDTDQLYQTPMHFNQQQYGYYNQQPNMQYQQQNFGYNNTYPQQQQTYQMGNGSYQQQYGYNNMNPQYQQQQYGYYNQQPNMQYGYNTNMYPQPQYANNGKHKIAYSCGRWWDTTDTRLKGPCPPQDHQELQTGYVWNGYYMEKTPEQRQKEFKALQEYFQEVGYVLQGYYIPTKMEDFYNFFDVPMDPPPLLQQPQQQKTSFTWDDVYQAEENAKKFVERMMGPHDESEEHFHQVMGELYRQGKVGFGSYSSLANGGLEYTTDNGVTVNSPKYNPFGFGGVYHYNNQYYQQQMELQKQIESSNNQMAKMYQIFGNIDKQQMSPEEIAKQEQIKKVQQEEMNNIAARRQRNFIYETQYDNFVNYVKNYCTSSDTPGYVSPMKQAYADHYNKVWDDRHKRVNLDMSFREFMIEGGYAAITFDEMRYQSKERAKKLIRFYDDFTARDAIHYKMPFYDPMSGTSIKGFSINDGEIHIELPPELVQQNYNDRRQVFFNKIMGPRNDGILPTDAEFFAQQAQMAQYAPPQQFMRM